MSIRRGEVGIIPFEIISDAEAEFADDSGRIAAAVVVAGEVEVGGWGVASPRVINAVVVGVFDVAMVVVGGEGGVGGEVLFRVTGAPFCVLYVSLAQVSEWNAMVEDEREKTKKDGQGASVRTIIWICKRLLGLMLRASSAALIRAHAVG